MVVNVAGVARVRMEVCVRAAVVCVHVHVIGAAAPAHEQPHGEHDDDHADQRLRRLLDDMRQEAPQQQDGQPEREQRRRVAEPPGEAEARGGAGGTPPRVGDERRDGDEVVGVRGVPETECEREQEDDERAVSGCVPAQEAVDARHWTIH
jgi:hypothetical protein